MTGYEFFRIYQPLHLHFTSNYDVIKYCGKSKNINISSFNKRRDSHLFDSWANKFYSSKDIGQYCLANFVYNEPNWIYQSKLQADEIFTKWKSIKSSITHQIQSNFEVLSSLLESNKVKSFFDFIQKTPNGNKPPLLQLFITGSIGKEFIVILDYHVIPFLDKWDKQYEIDPLISDQIFLLKKYAPFIVNAIDSEQIKNMYKEVVKTNES